MTSAGVMRMLYEDNEGRLVHPEELEEMSPFEIEERGIHLYDDSRYGMV